MIASIVVSNLTWVTPDGRPVLSDLNLSFDTGRTGLVGRNGVGKTTLLKLIAGDLRPHAGNISVNGTIGALRQTVRPATGETVAELFGVSEGLKLLRRAGSGEANVEEIARADWTLELRIASALGRLGLELRPDTRLATLSGGQRTRAALAALVFAAPDFILLDEPTNNLDRDGRKAVADLLAGWSAGAIVVSHDRQLLDLMDAIIELTSIGATTYGGNWSSYRARKAIELAAAGRELADAEQRLAEVTKRAQVAVERKARKDGVGRRKSRKGGMPPIVLGRLKDRSEKTSGENARLAERRRTGALADVAAARARIEILQSLSVALPSTRLPRNKTIVSIERVSAGYEPGQPVVRDLSLAMVGPERVAVVGPNGSGKTTLLALVAGRLHPWTGTVRVMTDLAILDQNVTVLDVATSIRDNFRRLNPSSDENACRAALARFMFRADTALQVVSSLSGGQLLRAGLACVLGGPEPPSLLILDEPTNHLDIDSIEAVEAGLRSYDGALLVVSHDERFLQGIGASRRLELSVQPARSGRNCRVAEPVRRSLIMIR